jgi:hypothetical protein
VLGRALRNAIKSWTSNRRVALIASGGLSRFVIDEAFDERVLAAIESRNEDVLARLPENLFRAGTAEIKKLASSHCDDERRRPAVPQDRLRSLLSLRSRNGKRDGFRVLGLIVYSSPCG